MKRALFLLLCAVVLAGCGNKHDVTTEAETEGIWVDVGELDYHIQGSRQLNPDVVPDDRYLSGLPEGFAGPKADETWFAIFVRIENKTEAEAPTAEEFEISDTNGEVYTPVPLDAEVNPYVFQPTVLGENEVVPHPDSSQELDSTAGSMILFKIPLAGYESRPLKLKIHGPEGAEPEEAEIDLDL